MMVYDLDGFLILNGKCFDYRCVLWNITKIDAINRLNNLDNKRKNTRWKKVVSRFKDRLVKMIKDVTGRFDDYSVSPKIRQILLH